MEKQTVKNIDNIVVQALHGPKVDGVPIYARIDGAEEAGFSGTSRTDKWSKSTENNYTSPTNVRRVFITGKRVMLQLYRPMIIKGAYDTRGTWRNVPFGDDSILGAAISSVTDKSVILKGHGLNGLSNPWVLSNVEEVYFDWTLLASESYKNAAIGCMEVLSAYINGKRGLLKSNVAIEMFNLVNMKGTKDLRSRFPRLRCIALISELEGALDDKFDKGETGTDSIEESISLWISSQENINLLNKHKSLMVVNEVTADIRLPNQEFALREGIYKYDQEVLSTYISNYIKRASEYCRKETSKEAVEKPISELEKYLISLEKTEGAEAVKGAIQVAAIYLTNKEKTDLINEISLGRKEEFAKLVG